MTILEHIPPGLFGLHCLRFLINEKYFRICHNLEVLLKGKDPVVERKQSGKNVINVKNVVVGNMHLSTESAKCAIATRERDMAVQFDVGANFRLETRDVSYHLSFNSYYLSFLLQIPNLKAI